MATMTTRFVSISAIMLVAVLLAMSSSPASPALASPSSFGAAFLKFFHSARSAYWKPIGIRNVGNTCYLGTSLRTLYMLSPLRNMLIEMHQNASNADVETALLNGTDVPLVLGEAMLQMMCMKQATVFNPTSIVNTLQEVSDRPDVLMNLREQHDLDDFLWQFLVEQQMADHSRRPFLSELIDRSFRFKDRVVTSHDDYPGVESTSEHTNREIRLSLSTDSKNVSNSHKCKTVKSCWRLEFDTKNGVESNLNGYIKDGNIMADTRRKMLSTPEILVIKIDRGALAFDEKEQQLYMHKDPRVIAFEEKMDISEFVDPDFKGEKQYKLAIVHMHAGEFMHYGHVYMYARDRRFPRTWIEFNDDIITEDVRESNVPDLIDFELQNGPTLSESNLHTVLEFRRRKRHGMYATPSALIYVRSDKVKSMFGSVHEGLDSVDAKICAPRWQAAKAKEAARRKAAKEIHKAEKAEKAEAAARYKAVALGKQEIKQPEIAVIKAGYAEKTSKVMVAQTEQQVQQQKLDDDDEHVEIAQLISLDDDEPKAQRVPKEVWIEPFEKTMSSFASAIEASDRHERE